MTMRIDYRMFLSAVAWALLVVSAPAFAAKEAEATHNGKVVSITNDTLVMTNMDGREHSHKLSENAKLTLDGKACKSDQLKPGMRIRVTTIRGDEKSLASHVEGISKNLAFASFRNDGKVVSIIGKTLVMTGTEGDEEQTRTITDDVKVTLDEKVCKPADLKPGMRIRVTSASDDPFAATRIEALDKNEEFASI